MDDAIKHLTKANTIFITAHRAPDGDAIGSCCGMKRLCDTNVNGSVRVIGMGDTPQSLRFVLEDEVLEDVYEGYLTALLSKAVKPVVLVMLDCSSVDRVRVLCDSVEGITTLNIDHHHTNTYYADVNIVVPDISSACEVALNLARHANWTVSEGAATALYTGLLTDTMGFTLSNTNGNSFSSAAFLVAAGAVPGEIAKKVFYSKTMLELKVAYVFLTRDDVDDLGLHGRLSYEFGRRSWEVPASIEGIDIGFSVTEHEAETGASFRSTIYDVSKLASCFGGGGHKAASGCIVKPSISSAEFINLILKEIEKM